MGKAGGGQATAKAKQAYRPPGARSGGGLADLLRKELGSTQADAPNSATKVFGNRGPMNCPPGAGGMESTTGGGSGAASRNARRRKAKEAAQQATAEGKDD